MSGSSGLNPHAGHPAEALYQPEMILWLYAKSEPTKAFDFCFDDGILRQYFEFDKQYKWLYGREGDEFPQYAVMVNCLLLETGERMEPVYRKIETVPMSLPCPAGLRRGFQRPHAGNCIRQNRPAPLPMNSLVTEAGQGEILAGAVLWKREPPQALQELGGFMRPWMKREKKGNRPSSWLY